MNVRKLVKEELVVFSEAKDSEGALRELAVVLEEKAYVKPSYIEAVIERERIFPTGLETENHGVAIPHTDTIHVKQPAIGISILKNQLPFIQMGSEDEVVQVKIIFMLALKKAEEQLELLQLLVELIQDNQMLAKLLQASNGKEVVNLIYDFYE